jgi:hypothetical protein
LLLGHDEATLGVKNRIGNRLMTPTKYAALAGALLLVTAAEFWGIYYDARHGVVRYQDKVTTALPAHR